MLSSLIKPSALIVGAQKAGTTAMVRNICQHPEILGTVTELDFFANKWEKGPEWYSQVLFKSLSKSPKFKDGVFIVEKSPSYLSNPDAAARIFEFNPDMKIIICLRNPVDRAFSRYNDIIIDEPGRLTKSFKALMDAAVKKPTHFLNNGIYAPQVKRYFDIFGRDKVKIVIQERWKANQYDTIVDVVDFLGFDDLPVFEVKSVHANAYKSQLDETVRANLNDFFEEPNNQLFDLLGSRIPEWEPK